MHRLEKLEAQRKSKIEELRALLTLLETEERSAFTDEESEKYEAVEAEIEDLDSLIEREKRAIELEKDLDTRTKPAIKPNPKSGSDPKSPAVHEKPEERDYSLFKAVMASATGNWDDAKVEKRVSDELSEFYGKPPENPNGFHAPYRALMTRSEIAKMDMERRAVGKAVPNTTGAALVANDLLPDEFIEILRTNAMTLAAGVRTLPNLVGDVTIPRQNAAASAGWVTEDVATSESTLTTDTITLSPKTVGLHGRMTRRMMLQSTPGIEDLVRTDMRAVVARAIDLAVLDGSGAAGQPTGILNTSGIGTVTTAAPPTWANMVAFETDLAEANALMGSLAFMAGATVNEMTKTIVKVSGQAIYLQEGSTINGYPMIVSTQVPADTIIFGNWAECLMGMWGSLDLFADPYTEATKGNLFIHGFQDVDVAIRHAASFSVDESFTLV